MNIQRDVFPQRGATSTAKPQFSLPMLEQVGSRYVTETFNAGTDFTVPAGAIGASVTIQLSVAPILGNNGRTGYFGNSTLVLGGLLAVALTTQVSFVADSDGKGGDVTGLSNGQFMVDYETATIYGKRASADVTGTTAYFYWAKRSQVTGTVSTGGSGPALAPDSGQKLIAVTGTAVALSAVASQQDILIIKANIGNAADIYLGKSTVTSATGLVLEQGRGVALENADPSTIFINGTAADGVSFFTLT